MINDALIFIAKEMNDYFRDVVGISEDCVIVSAITNRDGTITANTENKIVITVANIEADIIKNNIGIHNRSLPDPAGIENLNRTTDAVVNAVRHAKENNQKIICFIPTT